MASEVDICNLALGHLGDNATVASLNPPEGSAQAEHCARFYPMARDSLLELHTWGFATKRATLAQLGTGWPEWDYAYAQPSDALNILAVLPPDSTDDYSIASVTNDGNGVIYTDQADAVLRYTGRVEDTTKFSPTFVVALSWHLAAMLAGPIIKGDAGAAEAKRCSAMGEAWLSKAKESDANQRRVNPTHIVPWMGSR
jgi:hypothetical protein